MKKPLPYPRKCASKYCRGIVRRSEHSPRCHRCRLKFWKAKHPHAYAWGHLKRHARERGIKFTLTIQDYKDLTKGLDLTKLVSHTSLSISVDRTENSLGYHRWNVTLMSVKENSRKAYTSYWGAGMKPAHTPDEIRRLDVEYRDKCAKIADDVSKLHAPGSPSFWKEFRRLKIEMFETETA